VVRLRRSPVEEDPSAARKGATASMGVKQMVSQAFDDVIRDVEQVLGTVDRPEESINKTIEQNVNETFKTEKDDHRLEEEGNNKYITSILIL